MKGMVRGRKEGAASTAVLVPLCSALNAVAAWVVATRGRPAALLGPCLVRRLVVYVAFHRTTSSLIIPLYNLQRECAITDMVAGTD